ncbi:MAG: hypothetical protein HY953_04735, partial [Candidatus Rokubacteria bacterium]|nr:hypothetical protein [Candidatus Rokubacteria bacterium]
WIAEQLAGVPLQPGRRAVVLVAAERQAHAIRRHLCAELARPEYLAGVLLVRPVEFARELLLRAGTVRVPGWEDVRRLRILHLFESAALSAQLRYFSADQLRSGQGYVDAFARTIADLEASSLDAALALEVAGRLSDHDRLAADRLHDVAVTWQAADAGATNRATTAQVLADATAAVQARPDLPRAFGPIFAMLAASPSTALLRFLRTLPAGRAVFQDARPLRSETQRWRPLVGLPTSTPSAAPQEGTTERIPSAPQRELHLVQRFLFEPPETLTDPHRPRSTGADGSVDVEEYPSIEDEIEAAATWVTEQIAAGIAAEQIALIVPEIDPYAPLLLDRLLRATRNGDTPALPVYVAGGLSLAASPAGMRLHALLHAVARALEAEATIRILPALRRGEQDNDDSRARLSPSRAAEIVYGAGIVGGSPGGTAGASEWLSRLTRRRDTLRALLDDAEAQANPDEPEKRRHAVDRQESQRWLRDVEPILPAITALQQFAEDVLAGAPLDAVWRQLRAFCGRWLRLPPDPPNLLDRLDQFLQPVLSDPIAQHVTGPAAVRFLMDGLRRTRRPTARFGEPCVFIGTVSHAAGLSFAAVRVLGLAEGA